MEQNKGNSPNYPGSAEPRPSTERGNMLFMDPTISKDDTVGDISKKREMLSKFSSEPGRGQGQQKQPEPSTQGHVGVSPLPQAVLTRDEMGKYFDRVRQSSDDKSNMSDDGGRSWYPDIKANEQAKWRRMALAKRADPGVTTAGNSSSLKGAIEFQLDGNAAKAIDRLDKCRESFLAASATSENSKSTQPSGTSRVSIARNNETGALANQKYQKEVSQGPGKVENISTAQEAFPVHSERLSSGSKPLLEDQTESRRDRASQELQPTMSESLNAIAEKFLGIDVLDQRQDLSRYIAYLLDAIDMLGARINFLEAKDTDSRNRSTRELQALRSPESQANIFISKVLHRVRCSNRSHHHNLAYYEDKPPYRDRHTAGEGKLMGDKIVHSLDKYFGPQSNVSFLVVHEHYCTSYLHSDDRTLDDIRIRNLGPSKENLRIVAPLLQKALLQVAEYPPIQRGMNLSSLRDEGMGAPYPFLFHHHKRLVELARDETYEGVLTPLLEFLAENYRKEYDEANSLFEQGFVTGHHLTKLFKPNQMVLSRRESNVLEAHILYENGTPIKGKIHLVGWSWVYDGNELKRHPWSQDIDGMLDERTRIADLKVYPADFARAEDIKYLEKRGREFWNMRDQTYICYTGWDKDRLYHYVCATPPCPRRPF